MYSDKFGFLTRRDRLEWDRSQIEPVPEFDELRKQMDEATQSDGFVYPPIQQRYRVHVDERGEVVHDPLPGTQREADLYRLPGTHRLEIRHPPSEDEEEMRRGLAAFVMHFVGMLFGHRCQFWNWWIDGRVRMRGVTDAIIGYETASPFLQQAVDQWSTWDSRVQRVMINALYMHGRVPSHLWDWERFSLAYQVFDAGFRVAAEVDGLDSGSRILHADRWEAICDYFGLQKDSDRFGRIVELRNDLLHETLWANVMPGEFSEEGHYLAMFMGNFNRRLFLALLGIDADYVRSPWTSLEKHVLRPRP